MRWFIEVSPIGKSDKPAVELCVEAEQWQPALQKAREIRGDNGSFANFSIELLDDGYRAIDPTARLRYVVRQAPDDAPLSATDAKTDASSTTATSKDTGPSKEMPKTDGAVQGRASDKSEKPDQEAPKSAPKTTERAKNDAPVSSRRGKAAASKGSAPAGASRPAATRVLGSGASADEPAPRKRTRSAPILVMDEVPRPAEDTAPPPPAKSLPNFERFLKREDNPTSGSQLLYREYAYAVGPEVGEAAAEELIRDRFAEILGKLAELPSGQYVNLAVFDHKFEQRPLRPPIVTLTFKDWQGADPEVRYPRRARASAPKAAAAAPAPAPKSTPPPPPAVAKSTPPPPPAVAKSTPPPPPPVAKSTPPPAPSTPPPAPSTPPPSAPPPRSTSSVPPKPSMPPPPPPVPKAPDAAALRRSAPPAGATRGADTIIDSGPPEMDEPAPPTPRHGSGAPPALIGDADAIPVVHDGAPSEEDATQPERSVPPASIPPPPSSIRLRGDDLLAELFEAFHELEFLTTSLEGADFVLDIATQKLPCELATVSFFDINKREFMVVRQLGGAQPGLLARIGERQPIPLKAMRSHHSVVIKDAANDRDVGADPRWKQMGTTPRSFLCAPVELGGRYLGLIELVNPLDGEHFTAGDGHAMTYIGQQFAEFLGSRGLIIDPEVVTRRPPGRRK